MSTKRQEELRGKLYSMLGDRGEGEDGVRMV